MFDHFFVTRQAVEEGLGPLLCWSLMLLLVG
jgi:hypothetical protein